MPLLFRLPKQQPLDGNGDPYAGALAYFYLTGTTTATDTYSDAALTTPHANPVVADANGILPPIYMDPVIEYKLTLRESDGTLIYTVDPVQEEVTSLATSVTASGTNLTVTTDYQDQLIVFSGAYTATLPTGSTAGDGWRVMIANGGSGVVTITPSGSDTLNGSSSSMYIGRNSAAVVVSNGSTAWRVYVMGCEAGSYTGTQTGYAASLTPTVLWRKSGDLVTITIPSASTGTSNATTMTLDIPSNLTPANTVVVPCLVTDNGTQVNGIASISGTLIQFGDSAAAISGFTASGTKGFAAGTTIVYSLA